jgi:hypothetical protein
MRVVAVSVLVTVTPAKLKKAMLQECNVISFEYFFIFNAL